jgi:hypothetical protein
LANSVETARPTEIDVSGKRLSFVSLDHSNIRGLQSPPYIHTTKTCFAEYFADGFAATVQTTKKS